MRMIVCVQMLGKSYIEIARNNMHLTYHDRFVRHVIHAVHSISLRLNDNRGVLRQVQMRELGLKAGIRKTCMFCVLHIVSIDIWMSAFQVLLVE